MATASPGRTECPVCHEEYDQPKILPCSHRLCRECLISWLRSESAQATCPLCRSAILQGSEDDLILAVDQLPSDLLLRDQVESARELRGPHWCSTCDSPENPALHLCLECRDKLCDRCVQIHKKSSASRHHKTALLSTLTAEDLASNKYVACPSHPARTAELYCKSDHTLLCLLCFAADHRQCDEVVKVEVQAETVRRELEDKDGNLAEAETVLTTALAEVNQRLNHVSESRQKTTREIQETFERLRQALDVREKELTSQTNLFADEAETKLVNRKTSLEEKLSWTKGHRQLLGELQRTAVLNTLITMTARLESRISNLETFAVSENSVDQSDVLFSIVMTDKPLMTKLERDIRMLSDVAVVSRPRCFLDVTTGGLRVGRIVLELFSEIVPRTAENFRALCTGEKGYGYAGTDFHNVIPGEAVYGGFIPQHAEESIYGGLFEDENFDVHHDRPYLVSMSNGGHPNTNGTKFCINVGKAPSRDGKTVVFGQVIQGQSVVELICCSGRRGKKKNRVSISRYTVDECGQL